MPARIKKGDRVIVTTGRDKGKRGDVLKVFPSEERALVTGVNMVKRHTKPKGQVMQGGIIDKEMPIHVSNLMLVCGKDGPVKAGYRVNADGTKVRVCRKCGSEL